MFAHDIIRSHAVFSGGVSSFWLQPLRDVVFYFFFLAPRRSLPHPEYPVHFFLPCNFTSIFCLVVLLKSNPARVRVFFGAFGKLSNAIFVVFLE